MKLSNLSFAYGKKQIFTDLSLELPDSGITAISGPSGCGKTTLLRLIAGLEQPAAGSLPSPIGVSFLFQENRLLPGLPALQQVLLVLPKGTGPEQAMYWLRVMGLDTETGTLPEQLSGGMQRRTALARCLAYAALLPCPPEKRLLILDEPFTGVDPDRTRSIMASIRETHIPVLMTAHDALSLSLADTLIRL